MGIDIEFTSFPSHKIFLSGFNCLASKIQGNTSYNLYQKIYLNTIVRINWISLLKPYNLDFTEILRMLVERYKSETFTSSPPLKLWMNLKRSAIVQVPDLGNLFFFLSFCLKIEYCYHENKISRAELNIVYYFRPCKILYSSILWETCRPFFLNWSLPS